MLPAGAAPHKRKELSHLGGHDWGLEVLCPYSRRPVANGHEVLVLSWVTLDAIDRTVVFTRAHVEHTNTIVLFPVSKVDLTTMSVADNTKRRELVPVEMPCLRA